MTLTHFIGGAYMEKALKRWQIIGFVITVLAGSLLHFVYAWTGKSIFTATFSAVNESTWEHMKLLFFPMFIFALVEYKFFKDYKNFWCVKLAGISVGLAFIPVVFYTYGGVFGQPPALVNIAIFIAAAATAYLLETRLLANNRCSCRSAWICFFAVCFIALLFVLFTFATPRIPLFEDPINGTFGVNA